MSDTPQTPRYYVQQVAIYRIVDDDNSTHIAESSSQSDALDIARALNRSLRKKVNKHRHGRKHS
jgi:hypothetical protein